MKRLKYISNIALMGLLALGATSCEDWLTLYPQDRVVEENFWEDKNDLEGVRYAAYEQMGNTVSNLIIWGDLRSDAFIINAAFTSSNAGVNSTHENYQNIVDGKLDSTMTCYDWGGVYTTINYCNKVLAHGEEVLERDPQFTSTEWQEYKAEMTALRALNYFYLLRTFKDIPYSTRVINSDKEVMDFPAVNQLAVLDTLIKEVRSVAGKARNRFTGSSGQQDTHGLMTNTGIYALLTDMYLWRSALRQGRSGSNIISTTDEEGNTIPSEGGYTQEQYLADCDSVIYFGEKSLEALNNVNTMNVASSYNASIDETENYGSGLANAPLIKNDNLTSAYKNNQNPSITSYQSIFVSGNSRESMFELQFSDNDKRKNTVMNSFWSNNNDSHFAVNNGALNLIYGSNTTLFNQDCRTWYSCHNRVSTSTQQLPGFYNFKYNNCSFENSDKTITVKKNTNEYNNWIIYRQADVMLMIAEAYAVKGETAKCRAIVDAIHKRSTVDNVAATGTSNNIETSIAIVMKERLIELLGEGKRWFDLVRYAERKGGGTNPDPREPQFTDAAKGVTTMIDDFFAASGASDETISALKSRLKNRYGLYSPIYYMEKKANHGALEQNPVWNREK